MLFNTLIKEFQYHKIPFVIVGGYALALQGIVRATMDIDLVINLKLVHLEAAERCLQKLGLTSKIPVTAKDIFHFKKEYIEKRNLIAWSFVDFKNPTRQVDILINTTTSDIETEYITVAGLKVPVASLCALEKMKKNSNRPQDQLDIQMIQKKIKEP